MLLCIEYAELFHSKRFLLMEQSSIRIVMKTSEMEQYEYFFYWHFRTIRILKGICFFP